MLETVTLSNSADAVPVDHGDFTITKALAGDGDFSNSTFLFTYSCTDNTTGFLMVKGGKTSEHSEEVKAGSTCTVTEVTDSAFRTGYTLTAPEPQTVAIVKDQTAEVTMTNTYTKAKGSFSVTNTASGAPVADKEFTFTYTCDNGQEGTLKAKANGAAVNGPELPVGTECTIEQDMDKAQVDGYTLKAPASQKVTIGEKVLDLRFAGMYTSLAVPSPSADATAEPSAEPSAAPSAAPADKPAADAKADPNAKPSADATAEPSAEPSAAPSADPADKPAADANADPNAKPSADATATPSAEATTEPSAEETATPSASAGSDVNGDPNADANANPNAKPSASASSSTAAGDSSSSGATPPVTSTNSAAPAPADGAPSGSAGGPLASTGVRIGLPLGIAVVAVMGGALLVSRRRA